MNALERELRASIAGEVRFADADRAMYAYDASVYRATPMGVIIPRTVDDVVTGVDICREHGVPIHGRGCGTSLAGQCCNFGVVFDFSKYLHGVEHIDMNAKIARVRPGTVCDVFCEEVTNAGGFWGVEPATHDHCSIGGMIGNNSCGTHSLIVGKTVDNVEELDVLLYDGTRMRVGKTNDAELRSIINGGGRKGQIYRDLLHIRDKYADLIRKRVPKIPRRVSGYNIDQLLPENGFNVARALVGTESTCAIVLEAALRLHEPPGERAMVVLGYESIPRGAHDVPFILTFEPIAVEFFDHNVLRNQQYHNMHFGAAKVLPPGNDYVIVEFAGRDENEANEKAAVFEAAIKAKNTAAGVKRYHEKSDQQTVWEVRRHSGGTSRMGLDVGVGTPGWPNWEDAAVHPDNLGDYLAGFEKLLKKYDFDGTMFGHFGQACIHCRIDYDLRTHAGVKQFRSFMEDAADLVVSYDGSLSGEHGDGQGRAELIPKMFGEELITAFREFKAVWDPTNKMNPGIMSDPYPLDQNLREGTSYQTVHLDTVFQFAQDKGSFAEATNRCFGVGKCRHLEGGTMCPSFMVTREEKHSTRGRSRLLQEMMRKDGNSRHRWNNPDVKEALDLCLACKGCKGDCPVNVDMATYKAEFLSHWFARHLRPRSAFSMGLIPMFAPLASRFAAAFNAVTHAPALSAVVKWLGGVAPQRELPSFALHAFRAPSATKNPAGKRVVLWADTFNTYFTPSVAHAAYEALEDLGFAVETPEKRVCCGRPFYDYGLLNQAQSYLRSALTTLAPYLRDGTPVIGLEPSCIAVFRDELLGLFPNDLDAQRLAKQTFTLAEFLEEHVPQWEWRVSKLHKRALVQAHCHHQAVMKFEDDMHVMEKIGLEVEKPDSGCCGMAGSFGYERGEHYDVSIACGERVILPKVREWPQDQLIVADGFSCREQIEQQTGRHALHLAEVLRMAQLHGNGVSRNGTRKVPVREMVVAAAGVAAVAGAGYVLTQFRKGHNGR